MEYMHSNFSYGYKPPQKKNPFNKMEAWRKPWIAKKFVH